MFMHFWIQAYKLIIQLDLMNITQNPTHSGHKHFNVLAAASKYTVPGSWHSHQHIKHH